MHVILSAMFVSFIWGGVVGIWLQKKAMHNIMKIKTIDGTCEHIGNGEFVYIMNQKDYRKIVLGIDYE